MPRLPRPRTDRQRATAIALTNVVFLTLVTWLLAGSLPAGTDPRPTATVGAQPYWR